MIDAAWQRIERAGVAGRTLTLKVKFADFGIISRVQTRTAPITSRTDVEEVGREILYRVLPVAHGVRLLGLTLSGFGTDEAHVPRQARFAL